MVPLLPCEHSQTLHREGGLFIFTVNSLFHKDIAVLDQFCAYTVSRYGSLYVSGKLPTYPSPKPT